MTIEMEESRSRVEMAIIQSDHRAHTTCAAFEGNRQNDVAQAIFGGRRRHGRRRSDCRDRSLSAHHRFLLSQRLVIAELHSGAARSWNGRQLMSAPQTTMREAPVLLGSPIPVVLPFLKIGLDSF